MGIVVMGAVFVDIKGYPHGQYVPNGRNAGRVVQVHGGVSRNIAEDIANVELRPTFLSVVDNSGIGTDVIEKLRRHKVNVDYIQRIEGGLGTWLAVFGNDGDVLASISQRPDLSMISKVLDEHGDEIISTCDSVVVEIDMDSDIMHKVFDLAEKYDKKVYAAVSNMSIAMERRDLMQHTDCVVCNLEEAELLFSEEYEGKDPQWICRTIAARSKQANFPRMVVTMGENGAVYADEDGTYGICPAQRTAVVDTTGCGDSFFAGVTIGLTYGKTLAESCEIGTRLASSVIATKENVCPRFQPEEFGLKVKM